MATRYCGSLRLDIRWLDTGSYTVRVYDSDRKRLITLRGLNLSPFHAAKLAVDCAEAYDRVAEAAVSFAGNDCEDIYAYADCSDAGLNFIRRAPNGPIVSWQADYYADHMVRTGQVTGPDSEPVEPMGGLLRLIKGGKA